MKVVERLVVKDWEITAENGDHFEIKWGETYTTLKDLTAGGKVVVFSRYWLTVPADCFAPEVRPI